MKKFAKDVDEVDLGEECGISFSNVHTELVAGDVIECYKDVDGDLRKFNFKAGISLAY